MKRASVFKDHKGGGYWATAVYPRFATDGRCKYRWHDTHTEALAHALAAVGLAPEGDPCLGSATRPCGRGPCCLGDGHTGPCQL